MRIIVSQPLSTVYRVNHGCTRFVAGVVMVAVLEQVDLAALLGQHALERPHRPQQVPRHLPCHLPGR